ncbi:MAG: hypothetical protein FWE93_03080 [Alphaproteobacteria bacterium]|nr:hypothetical protein [Alphaproteobacteria bacterium]
MSLLVKKKYLNGNRKYYFLGVPLLSKRRKDGCTRTYLLGIRICKRMRESTLYTQTLETMLDIKGLINAQIKKNTVLIIEVTESHGDVAACMISYFLDLGYNVDIVLSSENIIHEAVSCMNFSKDKVRVFNGNIGILKSEDFAQNLVRYKWILLNTARAWDHDNNLLFKLYHILDEIIYKNNVRFILHHATKELMFSEELRNRMLNDAFVLFKFPILGRRLPFISATKYGSSVIEHKKNRIIKFFLSGAFIKTVRHIDSVIDSLCKLVDNGITDFRIVLITRTMDYAFNPPNKLLPFIEFKGKTTYPQLYDELNDSDFIMSGQHSEKMTEYLYNRVSGNHLLSVGFAKPMIMHEEIAAAYKMDSTNTILHKENELYDALLRCINMTEKEYDKYIKNLKSLRTKDETESLDNMRRVFGIAK